MKSACHIQTWGGVICTKAAVGSIKDGFYNSNTELSIPLEDIAEVGYKGFELFDGDLMTYSDNTSEFEELCEEKRLEPTAVFTAGNFIYHDAIEDEMYKIKTVAKIASNVGIGFIVIGGGANPSAELTKEHLKNFAVSLDTISSICEDNGVKAVFHPHVADKYNYEKIEVLLDMTDIDLCPDTGVLEAGGVECSEFINHYITRVSYVHLKDNKGSEGVELGTGEIDLVKILNILIKNGYTGWLTTELDSTTLTHRESAWAHSSYLKGLCDALNIKGAFNKL